MIRLNSKGFLNGKIIISNAVCEISNLETDPTLSIKVDQGMVFYLKKHREKLENKKEANRKLATAVIDKWIRIEEAIPFASLKFVCPPTSTKESINANCFL